MREREFTQKQLADLSGISQASVSKYVRGGYPGAVELYKLSKILGVTMEWLMGDNDLEGKDKIKEENVRLRASLNLAVDSLRGVVQSLEKGMA